MNKPPAIDLGSVKIPADAPFGEPPGSSPARSRSLKDFTTKELKDELLDRDVTDFSRLQPFIRNALLIVIAAVSVLTYWGMKCQDGEMFGIVCTISQ